MSMKIPNAYITKEAIWLDGVKVPGIIRDDPIVVKPHKGGNILVLNFLVENVVVEGQDDFQV